MVRREEQPRQLRATVLLDARRDGHRGEGPASSFEWGVVAAASIGVALAGQRYGIRLVVDERPAAWTDPSSGERAGKLLDELAVATWTGPESLTAAVATLTRGYGDGLVIAVLGEVGEDEAGALARLVLSGARGIAILLRTTAWTTLPAQPAAELDDRRDRAACMLRSGGWLVTDAGPEETIVQVWHRVTGVLRPHLVNGVDRTVGFPVPPGPFPTAPATGASRAPVAGFREDGL